MTESIPESGPWERRIQSFARRQGRLTQAQQKALDGKWARYGLEPDQALPPDFIAAERRVLEIGFGDGESLIAMAKTEPTTFYVGIEVHRPGIGHLLMKATEADLNNLRIYGCDAMDVLQRHIPDQSLDRLQLYFPDPWPKHRHHKRRLVKRPFLDLVARKLKPQGVFHAATDWADYADDMVSELEQSGHFQSLTAPLSFCERPSYRPITKFERRGQRLGHGVFDLIWINRLYEAGLETPNSGTVSNTGDEPDHRWAE
jgi:tRNA (guanine-N7-)-methyltransferase